MALFDFYNNKSLTPEEEEVMGNVYQQASQQVDLGDSQPVIPQQAIPVQEPVQQEPVLNQSQEAVQQEPVQEEEEESWLSKIFKGMSNPAFQHSLMRICRCSSG